MSERANNIVAVIGGAIGWGLTLTLTEAASVIAALATAAWFASQTYMLWRRERCTVRNCWRRKP